MIIRRLLVFSLLFLAAGCTDRQQLDEGRLASDLGVGGAVDLADYTDFDWDRVFVFPPYTSKTVILKVSGVEVDSAIEHSDSINLLVFKNEGKGVANIEISRAAIDFSNVYSKVGYKKESAVFTQVRSGDVIVRLIGAGL